MPRSEATALLHALATTKGNAVFVCDNYGVYLSYLKGDLYSPEANGLLWQELNRARRARFQGGYGFLEAVWINSHLSLEAAVNQGFPWQWWSANWCADKLAQEAAKRSALGSCLLEDFKKQDNIAKQILERSVEIAVALAPSAKGKKKLEVLPKLACISKLDQVMSLAKSAGHSLTATFSCARCKLQVPMHKSMAHLDAILHMKCPEAIANKFSGIELITLEYFRASEDKYLVGQVLVHGSHSLAIHFGLGLRFCSCCGAHGRNRSNNLKIQCPGVPTPAGKEAMRLILLGKAPDTYLKTHLNRRGLRVQINSKRRTKKQRRAAQGVIPTSLKRARVAKSAMSLAMRCPSEEQPLHGDARPSSSCMNLVSAEGLPPPVPLAARASRARSNSLPSLLVPGIRRERVGAC